MAALFLPSVASATAHNGVPIDDELLFYRGSDGKYIFYNVDSIGRTGAPIRTGNWSANWTSITGVNTNGDHDDELLFYRSSDGRFVFYNVTASGGIGAPLLVSNWLTGWTAVTGINIDADTHDELLFYRAGDGAYAFYNVDDTGALSTEIRDRYTWSANWTSIAGADINSDGDDELLLYRASDGKYIFYNVDIYGRTGPAIRSGNWSANWTSITGADIDSDGDDELLFYRASDGKYIFYNVDNIGRTGAPIRTGNWSANWTSIIGVNIDGSNINRTVERISVASDGSIANEAAAWPSASSDGRYVAFMSGAWNLAPDDYPYPLGYSDIFVRDRVTGTTERISVSSDGTAADRESYRPVISADGRFVLFASRANNLTPQSLGWYWLYIHDRDTGTTEVAALNEAGEPADSIIEQGDISGDGRFVVFASEASNLVPDDTNWAWGTQDIFLRDRQTGIVEELSRHESGSESTADSSDPHISTDGRYVIFTSNAPLVAGDVNGASDVYLVDRQLDTIELVSVAEDGSPGNSSSQGHALTADGSQVLFTTLADNLHPDDDDSLVALYIKDRITGSVELVTIAPSERSSMSADGRLVVFSSAGNNLVPGDTNSQVDVFVKDRLTGAIVRVSTKSDGSQLAQPSYRPTIAASARIVFFEGFDLLPGETNGIEIYAVSGW